MGQGVSNSEDNNIAPGFRKRALRASAYENRKREDKGRQVLLKNAEKQVGAGLIHLPSLRSALNPDNGLGYKEICLKESDRGWICAKRSSAASNSNSSSSS